MRRAEALAWAGVALAVALLAATFGLGLMGGRRFGGAAGDVLDVGLIFSTAFPVIGALVVRQRSAPAVGWLLSGIGVSLAFHGAAVAWVDAAVRTGPDGLPGGEVAAWIETWAWTPGWLAATTLLPTIFPEGRPAGRRRLLAAFDAVVVGGTALALAAVSWPERAALFANSEDGTGPAALQRVFVVCVAAAGLATVLSFASLVVRFRRETPVRRRQIAWVVHGATVAVAASLLGAVVDLGGALQVLEAGALVAGFAVALLRHRLYDLDVVVNRTLVYGALSATLGATYLGSVLLLQLVLGGLAGDSSLAVAGSTLAVAAAFRPLRTRIQAGVDRRFYRGRYDAQRTLESFAARLRDDVAVEALSADLQAVVATTMRPAHLHLWLREPEPPA